MKSVYDAGHELYRGSLIMAAGMPGASKSMFALALTHAMNVPVLYVSADSDAGTQISRLASIITGVNTASVRHHLAQGGKQADRFIEALKTSKVEWSFDSNPDAFDIEDEVSAWVELRDTFPEVIVIDNLRNVYSGNESEHGGYKATQQALIDITRKTGAMVLTLHHMKEANNRKATDPAPRSAIDGMVAQLPAQIFSVAREDDEFRLAVVKDRETPNDPEAGMASWHRIRSDGATSRFFYQRGPQAKANELGSAMHDRGWSDVPLAVGA